MEINIRDDRQIIEIWLTSKEQQDQRLEESLSPLYQQCREKKYIAAVFRSGSQDLTENTGALLCRSKRRIAELEVQQERKRREAAAR